MEASGEIQTTEKPQAVEAKEVDSNFGLSVNGSQIKVLAVLDYLEEYKFSPPKDLNLDSSSKNRNNLQGLEKIKQLLLQGETQEVKRLLQRSITLRKTALQSDDLIDLALEVLSEDVSVPEALKDEQGFRIDKNYRDFIESLPGQPLKNLPKESSNIYLTELGARAAMRLESAHLDLFSVPIGRFYATASLPLDQQSPLAIEETEVYGKEGKEAALAKLEVFAELARRYPKVFTHMTGRYKFPTIIQSGHFGKDYGKGVKGNTQEQGLYAETLTFKDALKYDEVIQQLRDGKDTVIPWDEINPNRIRRPSNVGLLGSNYPLHELTFIELEDVLFPIAIFSDQLPQEHKIQGWMIDGAIDIKDKCLVGIWVTPQYKQHLLHWISTWTEEKRQEVFGDKKPENVLISSAEDLPSLEK